ncbi:MAG TPA: complex I NDUFA9 subunit family protein [Alphaproteobacteria bacterium]
MTDQRRIVVFGGSGFIGRHVVERLRLDGWRVRVAARHPERLAFAMSKDGGDRVEAVRADIAGDPAAVEAAVDGAEAVANLVGILYERGRQSFERIHVDAAGRLGMIAAAAGARRFIHISALGAAATSPSAYARSKATGEIVVRRTFPPATIFRPSIVIGPGDHFFNRFARMARYSPALPLIGGGNTRFQPVYVGDVAAALATALRDPATQGRNYELVGPRTYTFRELMMLMLVETHRTRLLVSLPFPIARMEAGLLELLPRPPLTRDQVKQLARDNIATPEAPGMRDLGLVQTPIESVLSAYLASAPPAL